MFKESIKKITLLFDSWSTDRKTVKTGLENQVKIRPAANIVSSKESKTANQTIARKSAAIKKTSSIYIFHFLTEKNTILKLMECIILEVFLPSIILQLSFLINTEI